MNKILYVFITIISISIIYADEAFDLYYKGWEFQSNKQFDKALEYYKKSIKLDPDNSKYYYAAGRLLFEEFNKLEESKYYFNKVIKLNPDDTGGYYYLGNIYYKLGEIDASYMTYNDVLDLLIKRDEIPPDWLLYMLTRIALWDIKPALIEDTEYYLKLADKFNINEEYKANMTIWLSYYYDLAKRYKDVIKILDDFSLIKYRPAYAGYLISHAYGEEKEFQKAIDILIKSIDMEYQNKNPEKGWIRMSCSILIEYVIILGDKEYLKNNKKNAYLYYLQAYSGYEKMPFDKTSQREWEKRLDNKISREYTTNYLYFDERGRDRKAYIANTFLEQKLIISKDKLPEKKNAVIFRVAIVIVRNTDLDYIENGKKYHESNFLDNNELEEYKTAWRFTADAFQYHSRGECIIKTDWFDLKDSVLTGLKQSKWKNLIATRHLDPEKIFPYPKKLLKKLSYEYDAVLFCWDRGNAALAYGGGPISFRVDEEYLPVVGCVRSISPLPSVNMHEFLHNIRDEKSTIAVHGPLYPPEWPEDYNGDDECDWYGYLISKLTDWKRVKYRE